MPWWATEWPNGVTPATVTTHSDIVVSIFTGAQDLKLITAAWRAAWTSVQSMGTITAGARVLLSQAFLNPDDTLEEAVVHVRMAVNDTRRFSAIWLGISDVSATGVSENILSSLTGGGTYDYIATSTLVISSLDPRSLRVFLLAIGTEDDESVGVTSVEVESFTVVLTEP